MASVDDRWHKTVAGERERTASYGRGRRWRVRWRDPDGSARNRSFERRSDADRYAADVQTSMSSATYIDPGRSRATVGEIAETWLEVKAATRKRKTAAGYRELYRTLVEPVWGRVPLARVDHGSVQAWVADLSGRGLSASRTRQAYNVLRAVLELAVKDRRIGVNPARGVDLPRVPVKSGRAYLTHGELEAIADRCTDRRALVLLLGYGGLRWGEAIALRVRDVDRLRQRVRIERTYVEVDNRLVEDTPKTHKARWVPVAGPAWEALEEACAGKGADELVFADGRGGALRARNFRRDRFDAAASAVGRTGLTPHDLRHTAASIAISSGASVLSVQRMLGHARASTTLDIYADLFDDDLDDLAARISEAAAAAPAWEPPRSIAR